ncbi:Glucan-binding domain-containing protein (YG repeat) [Lachnospiraceae bacterium NE2001]|nr:Glucan-binding domain-containing protein (YG repeat) [Lachnospiraceae bacterium NE2001]
MNKRFHFIKKIIALSVVTTVILSCINPGVSAVMAEEEDVWNNAVPNGTVHAMYGDYCKRCGHCLGDIESLRCYEKYGFYIINSHDVDARKYLDEAFSTEDDAHNHIMLTDLSKSPNKTGIDDPDYDYTDYPSDEKCEMIGTSRWWSSLVYENPVDYLLPAHTVPEIEKTHPIAQVTCKESDWAATIWGKKTVDMKYTGEEVHPELRVISDGVVLDEDSYDVFYKCEENGEYNFGDSFTRDWTNTNGCVFENYLYDSSDPVPESDPSILPGKYAVIIRFNRNSKFRGMMRIEYHISEYFKGVEYFGNKPDGTHIFIYRYEKGDGEYFYYGTGLSEGTLIENETFQVNTKDGVLTITCGNYVELEGYDTYEETLEPYSDEDTENLDFETPDNDNNSADGTTSYQGTTGNTAQTDINKGNTAADSTDSAGSSVPVDGLDNRNNTGNSLFYSKEWYNGKWYDADGAQSYDGTLSWKYNSVGWWVEDSNGWYPVSQWQKIDGDWYYFDSSGYMASDEWVGGYWINGNGTCTYDGTASWKKCSGGWWYGDTYGWYAYSQWQKIDSKWYYFDSSGIMVTSKMIDGYWIDSDGVCQ